MVYEVSDSSGTDDDLPPSHQNRFARGHVAGNGRSAVSGPPQLPRMHNDMETQIHLIEQEAYSSVLRAFKAQSDAISWEKESLITELRKELRVSDDEHRELLSRVNADDMIKRIREWRKGNLIQLGMMNVQQTIHDKVPSPTTSVSRKKKKASQPLTSSSVAASPVLHSSMQPSSSTLKRGPPPGPRDKKAKQNYSSSLPGRALVSNHAASGGYGANECTPSATLDLIGRKVWTRWPEDNTFYEAVITDYDPNKGLHLLTYYMGTANEAFEWMDLKECSPEDLRWEDEDVGSIQRGGLNGGVGRGAKKPTVRGSAPPGGRGRGSTKGQHKKDLFSSQNGIGRKPNGDIQLLHTDSLIKEVEKLFIGAHPDPSEVEKAKNALKEHEQALVDAIARLEDASDGESDGERRFSQGQSIDQERTWRKRQFDEMCGEGRGGLDRPDGEKIIREGRVASSDKQRDGGE